MRKLWIGEGAVEIGDSIFEQRRTRAAMLDVFVKDALAGFRREAGGEFVPPFVRRAVAGSFTIRSHVFEPRMKQSELGAGITLSYMIYQVGSRGIVAAALRSVPQ
jgi:hypothetical protein